LRRDPHRGSQRAVRLATEPSQRGGGAAAVDLAQQSLDAEQKKYALGARPARWCLQQSSALTQSRSNLVAARAAYEKSPRRVGSCHRPAAERNGIDLPTRSRAWSTSCRCARM